VITDRWRPFVADLLLAGAAIAVVGITDNPIVRTPATVLLVFYLPGAACLRALRVPLNSFPESQALTVAASISLTILSGLVINTVTGLTPRSWILALTVVLLVLSLIGVSRNAVGGAAAWQRIPLRTGSILAAGLAMAAVIVTGAAFAMAIHREQIYQPFRFTDLWIARDRAVGPDAFIVGVKSEEVDAQNFDVEVWAGDRLVAVWRSIRLEPGHSFIAHVPVPQGSGTARKVRARLFRDGDGLSVVYRNVSLLVEH
jgi:hypothetical protein